MDTDTLDLLADSLKRYGRERYSFEARQARLFNSDGFSRDAWADYAAMGLLAMPQAMEEGGFDSAPEAIGVLMQYVGASLALEPVFASVVLCGRMLALADDQTARETLRELAEGSTLLALAHAEDAGEGMQGEIRSPWRDGRLGGRKVVVLHGDRADRLLVSARDDGVLGLFLVDLDAASAHFTRTPYQLIDGRGAATIEFHDAPAHAIARGPDAEGILARSLDEARLALCAEAYGASKALNAATLAYLKERRQFGHPIGANQALQHRMVELYMLEEECHATMQAAYRAGTAQRQAFTCAALAQAMTLARTAAHEAVQMHGGIGITEELAVSHFFRRLMVIERLLGDRDLHMRRFAAA